LLCDIFEEYGVRPTFFVDYATCECHGELPIFGVTEYLLGRNMDVQLHMHCEVLIRERKWESRCRSTPFFDSLPYDLALEVIEFGRNKYHDNTGIYPRIFRPGGMKRNIAMYEACKSLGFEAVSAIYQRCDRKCWKDFGHKGLVQFDNGILEMPLDFALDPLDYKPDLGQRILKGISSKSRKITSLLLHSWSLSTRHKETGYHYEHNSAYEATLRNCLVFLSKHGVFASHCDLLDDEVEDRLCKVPLSIDYCDSPPKKDAQ
jgi:hypothetical protein